MMWWRDQFPHIDQLDLNGLPSAFVARDHGQSVSNLLSPTAPGFLNLSHSLIARLSSVSHLLILLVFVCCLRASRLTGFSPVLARAVSPGVHHLAQRVALGFGHGLTPRPLLRLD
jgi:hypothetical protein